MCQKADQIGHERPPCLNSGSWTVFVVEVLASIATARSAADAFGAAYAAFEEIARTRLAAEFGTTSLTFGELEMLLNADGLGSKKNIATRLDPGSPGYAKYKAEEDRVLRMVEEMLVRRSAGPRVSTALAMGPIAKLQFLRRIASGGEAEVWEAIDELDRPVAVKLFHDDSPEGQTALEHARALARVRNDNVVTVHAVARVIDPRFTDGRTVEAIILEKVDGTTLEARIVGGPAMTHEEVARIGDGILAAVAAFHAAGVQHGDLHEGQVLLWSDGRVRVTDIFYGGSLRFLSTMSKEARWRHDRLAAFGLLVQILFHSELPASAASEFQADRNCARSLVELRERYVLALAQQQPPPYSSANHRDALPPASNAVIVEIGSRGLGPDRSSRVSPFEWSFGGDGGQFAHAATGYSLSRLQALDYLWPCWNTAWFGPRVVSKGGGTRALTGLLVDLTVSRCSEVVFGEVPSPFDAAGRNRLETARTEAKKHTRATHVDSEDVRDEIAHVRFRVGLMPQGKTELLPVVGFVLPRSAVEPGGQIALEIGWQIADSSGLLGEGKEYVVWVIGPKWAVHARSAPELMFGRATGGPISVLTRP